EFSSTVLETGIFVLCTRCDSNLESGIPATAAAKMNAAPGSRVLVIGASARAAAWSARRAGCQPVCAGQFPDRDLHQIAEVIPIKHYPSSLLDDLAEVSSDAWMFVGAMENHRRALIQLTNQPQFGRYCGPDLDAISHLRDPFWLAERLAPLKCFPHVALTADG